MKKKNLLWSMLAILMVTMLSVGITACGNDDDDDKAVVGTWSSTGQNYTRDLTLTFKSDGTGTYIIYNNKYHKTEDSGTMTYVMEGDNKGMAIFRFDSYYGYEYETFYFVIEGKTMAFYSSYYYDELEWILRK